MRCERRGPNFLILGAQKAGTTWLADVLGRQPGVFIPPAKELHYFSRHYRRGEDWYHSFFDRVPRNVLAQGEATPNYLAVTWPEYREVAHRIALYGGDLRFVVVLRNPVDRALSAYLHHLARGRFSPLGSPEAHLEALLGGEDVAGVLSFGRYGEQLSRYFATFGRERFKIILYDDLLRKDPRDTIASVLAFLGCPAAEPVGPFDRLLNVSLRTRGAARLAGVLSVWMRDDEIRFRFGGGVVRVARLADRVDPRRLRLSPDIRQRLAEHYAEDAAVLRDLLRLPAPVWPDFTR
jgi:hypothetical protein